MKSIGVIVIAVAALASFTGVICNPVDTEIEPNCDLYKPIPGIGLACKRKSNPVCGTNGRTYENECLLCSDKLKVKIEIKIKYRTRCIVQPVEDECQGYGGACTREYNPVCGSDAVTYSNKCNFCNAKRKNADLIVVSQGQCTKKSAEDECQGYGGACTREYNPVCGSDAVTYPNKCNFCNAKIRNTDLIVVSEGQCTEKSADDECQRYGEACPMIYLPVCGSDAVTYPNKCSFCNAKKRNADLIVLSEGQCTEKSADDECQRYGEACPMIYLPVCGSDAVTYPNKCSFCNAKKRNADLIVLSEGQCTEKSAEDECQGYEGACTREYNPVCGSDAVTYSNKCNFCNAKRRNADLIVVSEGGCIEKDECEGFGEMCTANYSPVCGSDNITYGNKCMLCGARRRNAGLQLVSIGECPKQS